MATEVTVGTTEANEHELQIYFTKEKGEATTYPNQPTINHEPWPKEVSSHERS